MIFGVCFFTLVEFNFAHHSLFESRALFNAPLFKDVGEKSMAKNYRPVSFLSVVSKIFKKLVNIRLVDHLEKCCVFSDFQYGVKSSRSTADLLTVASDKIARVFIRSGATRAVAIDISNAFNRL